MSKTVTVHEDDENVFIHLDDFLSPEDRNRVVYYSIKKNKKDDCLVLKLYDKKKKLINFPITGGQNGNKK